MPAGGMADEEGVNARPLPQGSEKLAQLAHDIHDADGWAQGVGRQGDGEAGRVELAGEEGILRAVAALPIAAMDVDHERARIGSAGEEIVALPLARTIGEVEPAMLLRAIFGGGGKPARVDGDMLGDPGPVVVLGLVIKLAHEHLSRALAN